MSFVEHLKFMYMTLTNPSIVVLDGHCLNPGDLSWKALEALGKCTFYERTPPEQLAERVRRGGYCADE